MKKKNEGKNEEKDIINRKSHPKVESHKNVVMFENTAVINSKMCLEDWNA